jgi:hypothetical protein
MVHNTRKTGMAAVPQLRSNCPQGYRSVGDLMILRFTRFVWRSLLITFLPEGVVLSSRGPSFTLHWAQFRFLNNLQSTSVTNISALLEDKRAPFKKPLRCVWQGLARALVASGIEDRQCGPEAWIAELTTFPGGADQFFRQMQSYRIGTFETLGLHLFDVAGRKS